MLCKCKKKLVTLIHSEFNSFYFLLENFQELIAFSTDEFEAHSHSNHHNSAHHVGNSAFSPEPLSDTESVVCENKMATTDVNKHTILFFGFYLGNLIFGHTISVQQH